MTYRFDPELAAVLPAIPAVDFSDVAAARAGLDELSAQASAQIDTTGVLVQDRLGSRLGRPSHTGTGLCT